MPLIAALVAGLAGGMAEAAPSGHDAAAMKAARPYAEKGFELYRAGDYAESIAEFQRAEARYHAPPHLLYMARAHQQLGQLIEARDLYQEILRQPVDESAPQAFHRAVVEARAEVAEVGAAIPTIVLEISGTALDRAMVTIDSRQYGALPERIELNPGAHTIEVSAPSVAPYSHTVTLERGELERLRIELGATAGPTDDPLLPPAVVALSVAGLGLLIGTVTGAVSLSQAADIDEQCLGDHCPVSLASDADDAKTIGHVSTAAFVIAGLAAATGATLLILGSQEDDAEQAHHGLRLRMSVGAVGLEATF